MKLPLITSRVKDGPSISEARPTSGGGSRAWCASGTLFTGDSGTARSSQIQVVAAASKTYLVQVSVQYYDNFNAISPAIGVDLTLSATSTNGSGVYQFSWTNWDVTTSAAGDRACISVSSVHSQEVAGTHTFYFDIADNGYGGFTYYSMTVVETDYTGASCFTDA